MDISERKKKTLRYIVEAYISGGEPVGSKYLTDSKKLAWSSATVRNDMMELEKSGYLYQPHTSAGRVPTTAGYQAYVNELMESYEMSIKEIEQINGLLSYKMAELDKLVKSAGKVASYLSNYTAITVKPKKAGVSVKRFEITWLDEYNFVLIIVSSVGLVKSSHLRSPLPISSADTASLVEMLNSRLCGITQEQITLNVISGLEISSGYMLPLLHSVLGALNEAFGEFNADSVEFEGVTNLLKYPEFSDSDTLSEIINLPNNKDQVLALISENAPGAIQTKDGIKIIIGDDSASSPIKDYGIVYTNFDAGPGLRGVLGVIGPKRMEYSKVVAHLKYLSTKLHELSPPDNNKLGDIQ